MSGSRKCEPGCTCGRHTVTPETREKIRQSALKRFSDPEVRARHQAITEVANRRTERRAKVAAGVRASRMRRTHYWRPLSGNEQRMAAELLRRGVVFDAQRRIEGTTYFPDFSFPDRHLIVEVHGAYWHGLPGRVAYDAARTRQLESLGWTVVVIRDEDIGADEALRAVLDGILDQGLVRA